MHYAFIAPEETQSLTSEQKMCLLPHVEDTDTHIDFKIVDVDTHIDSKIVDVYSETAATMRQLDLPRHQFGLVCGSALHCRIWSSSDQPGEGIYENPPSVKDARRWHYADKYLRQKRESNPDDLITSDTSYPNLVTLSNMVWKTAPGVRGKLLSPFAPNFPHQDLRDRKLWDLIKDTPKYYYHHM